MFVLFNFRPGYLGTAKLFPPDEDGDVFCRVNVDLVVDSGDSQAELIEFQSNSVELCRGLLGTVGVYSAELYADGGGCNCLPEVPLVDGNSHLAVTNQREVEKYYADPAAFFGAGWNVEKFDGQHLLTRDLDVVAGADYLSRIMPHQWAMARAAKARRTTYRRPRVLPEEQDLYVAGNARLQGVGYRDTDQTVEFACALNPGEHIHGWEIFALLNVIEKGELSDGSAVKTVQVVFDESWSAEQEKRPLLDIGCRVYFYGDTGELQEIVE
ncbi:MAG: hypothetical protein QNJ40_12155 [Xanthomonadales bacterium]|nr:hypothetical protein [Xanthomonadales bacterium]